MKEGIEMTNNTVNTFEGLPEQCWGVLYSSNELILIKRGVKGYFPQREENAPYPVENVDHLNNSLGVTKGQRMAMEQGSMFGWDTPASNPANYDDEGNWIK